MSDKHNEPTAYGTSNGEERPTLALRVGTKLDPVHTIIDERDPDLIPDECIDTVAKNLGQGGSSTVYLASYRKMQQRAVKFLTMPKLSDKSGRRKTDFQTTFNNERIFLSKLAHGNITRLYDFGAYKDERGVEWQYIVVDYIAGEELRPALEADETKPEDAYRLLSQVLNAIEYMHAKRVMHADIKWENIKCRQSPAGPEAVVLDLGTLHYVPENNKQASPLIELDPNAPVRFITTERITHDKHKKYLEKKISDEDGLLDNEMLRDLFPYHDIHALGVLLDEMTMRPSIVEKLEIVIGRAGMNALKKMIGNLKGSPVTHYYTSINQIHKDWRKLRRSYLAPAGVPELSLAAEFKYSVSTSAGRGVITPRLSPIVNHKLFQRLRRVPQLEMTLMKFPGATHSRFAHSMAVLRNTRYYLAHLLNDPNFRLFTEQHDLEAAILLGLLHDVGHYQLSHMFEDYASNQRGREKLGPWKRIEFDIPTDDDLFWYVVDPCGHSSLLRGEYEQEIRTYGDAIEQAWRESEGYLGLLAAPTLKELIIDEFSEATYEAMQRIHHAIYDPGRYPETKVSHLVLGAVLSSDIDADKVSYLIEDSSRSGVNYGSGVDFDGLIGALRMPALHQVQGKPTLGITHKGLAAAQSIAISRNLMVGQVYWHHTNRAATAMVKYAIARMLNRAKLSLPKYIRDTFFLEYEAALGYLFDQFQKVRQENEVNPIAGLASGERRIYKTAFSTTRLDDRDAGDSLGEHLVGYNFDDILDVEDELCEELRVMHGLENLKQGEVLIDIPLKERQRTSGDRGGRVYVYNTPTADKGEDLREYTAFMKNIKEQHTRENRVCRVFVAPRLTDDESTYKRVMDSIAQFMLKKAAR